MEKNLNDLLQIQKESILNFLHQHMSDTNNDKKIENIALILTLYIDSLFLEEYRINTSLQAIATKIAKEKAPTDINIYHFMKKLNGIKETAFCLIEQHSDQLEDTSQMRNTISKTHDTLLQMTLTEYINRKIELGIQEKEKFSEAHKERLIMLGQMTSTFVHEIRNPLTSIKGFVQLLKADHPNLKYLDIISEEIQQLNDRLTQFLNFSKKEQISLLPTQYVLKELIEEIEIFLYPSFVYKNIEVLKDIDECIILTTNRDEIRQVLLNILLNALDALDQKDHPQIAIAAKIRMNNTIEVSIANNGPKINEDIIEDIFKPFTTTKKAGTGIGLFVCNQIIENNKGTLSCISTDEWTTFIINLPSI